MVRRLEEPSVQTIVKKQRQSPLLEQIGLKPQNPLKPPTQRIERSDTVLDRISRVTIRDLGPRSQGNTDSDVSEPISPTVEAPGYQSGSRDINRRKEERRRSRSVSPVGIVTLVKEKKRDKDEVTLPIIYPDIPDPRKQIAELLHAETQRKTEKTKRGVIA